MQKYLHYIKLILLLTLFFPNTLFADPRTFTIGVSLPLSGNLAHVGHDIQQGILLAVKDWSQKDLKLKVVFEDDQFTSAKAVTAAKKLIERDKVEALISLWDMADLIAPFAERQKIPHLAIRWNPEIAEKFVYSFTIESTYHSVVREQIRLMKEIGVENLVVLGTEEKSTNIAIEETKKVAQENGIIVSHVQQFLEIDSSFNSILIKAIQKKPDMLMLWTFPPVLELSIQKAIALNPNIQLFGMFNDIPTKNKPLVNGMPFVMMYRAADWFKENFRKTYGKDFEVRAPHAYDALTLLAKAAASVDVENPERSLQMVNFLKSVKNYPGASGILTTSKTKNIETGVFWMIMEEGRPRDITESDLVALRQKIQNYKNLKHG